MGKNDELNEQPFEIFLSLNGHLICFNNRMNNRNFHFLAKNILLNRETTGYTNDSI